MFGLSFWRHPFTAEHPLLRHWCNATFLQIMQKAFCMFEWFAAWVISLGFVLVLIMLFLFNIVLTDSQKAVHEVLVGVLSARHHHELRQAIRDTWLGYLKHHPHFQKRSVLSISASLHTDIDLLQKTVQVLIKTGQTWFNVRITACCKSILHRFIINKFICLKVCCMFSSKAAILYIGCFWRPHLFEQKEHNMYF